MFEPGRFYRRGDQVILVHTGEEGLLVAWNGRTGSRKPLAFIPQDGWVETDIYDHAGVCPVCLYEEPECSCIGDAIMQRDHSCLV